MVQALALVILLVLGAALYNKLKQSGSAPQRKSKSGDVIDISEAWIAMDNLPYRRKESMLSPEEILLYAMILDMLPAKYVLCPRVRLADLLALPGNVENRQAYQARLNDRAVDFVICSRTNMQPVLAIFAETETEARKKQIRDGLVRKAFEAANLPSLTIKVDPLPGSDFLSKQLQKEGITWDTN